jgi:protein-tyrosine phosphatase
MASIDTSERAPLPAITNFRDAGGQPSHFGGRVAEGQIFRSGHLAGLDDRAVADLLGLDFRVIVDLRYTGEREAERSPWPDALVGRVLHHGSDREAVAPHLALLAREGAVEDDVVQFFRRFYARLPFDTLYQPLYAGALRAMADEGGPVLIHCSAGKDRTGVLTGLLLHILGVDREAIFADYMETMKSEGLIGSAERVAESVEAQFGRRPPIPVIDRLLEVRPEYLARSFASIEEEAGSMDAYFDQNGVGEPVRERIRERFLVA